MRKTLLLMLIFLLFSSTSYGQNNSYEYLDTLVTNYVKELQSQNIDTICVYKDYCIGCIYPIKNETDGCDYFSIYVPTYILWIKQGKTFLSKKDNCFDYFTIEIDSISLWKIFFKNKKHIEKEKVKPFEYIIYKKNKKEVYGISIDHSRHRDFEMIVNDNNIVMKFDEFDLQEKSSGETNINYEHNKNLYGQLIICELKNLVQYIEKEKLLTKNSR